MVNTDTKIIASWALNNATQIVVEEKGGYSQERVIEVAKEYVDALPEIIDYILEGRAPVKKSLAELKKEIKAKKSPQSLETWKHDNLPLITSLPGQDKETLRSEFVAKMTALKGEE